MQLLAHLEATCEELQSCAKLSVVEQALQGSQALQPHLTLLVTTEMHKIFTTHSLKNQT